MTDITHLTLMGSTADSKTDETTRLFRCLADRGDDKGGAADGKVSLAEAMAYIADAEKAIAKKSTDKVDGKLSAKEMVLVLKHEKARLEKAPTAPDAQKHIVILSQNIYNLERNIKLDTVRGTLPLGDLELLDALTILDTKLDAQNEKKQDRPLYKVTIQNAIGEIYSINQINYIYKKISEQSKEWNGTPNPKISDIISTKDNIDWNLSELTSKPETSFLQKRNSKSVYYGDIDAGGVIDDSDKKKSTERAVLRLLPKGDGEPDGDVPEEVVLFSDNPSAQLIDDCQGYLAPAVDYRQTERDNVRALELEMKIIAREQGGDDGKLKKFVLSTHSCSFSTLRLRAHHGPISGKTNPDHIEIVDVDALNLAQTAAKYVEPKGQLVISACSILPELEPPYPDSNGEQLAKHKQYVTEYNAFKKGLKDIAKEHDIYIVTSRVNIDYQQKDGVTGDMIVITPSGGIIPYETAKRIGYVS